MNQEEFNQRMEMAYIKRRAFMNNARTMREMFGPRAYLTVQQVQLARMENHHILWLRREARRQRQRDRHPLDRFITWIQRAL